MIPRLAVAGLRLALVSALVLASHVARAEWSAEFVRVACIPEARYFQFEYKAVDGQASLVGTDYDEKKMRERALLWARNGYFDPHGLKQECHLPEVTYTLLTSQPPATERGRCAAAPAITLNLLRNGMPLIKDVVFGDNCFGGPSIISVEILDGADIGGSRQMSLCVLPAIFSAPKCKFLLEPYDQIADAVPITRATVDSFLDER